jgi:hypothetical protein
VDLYKVRKDAKPPCHMITTEKELAYFIKEKEKFVTDQYKTLQKELIKNDSAVSKNL